ncbi:hypothetical protein M2404_004063 [Rheinheimera pacifica]|nr:hypothetical protein [Rheinheimera pacifica]
MWGKKEVYGYFGCVFISLFVCSIVYGDTRDQFQGWFIGALIFFGLFVGEWAEDRKKGINPRRS